jgi:branched-chain amino acid transport system permease protein
MGLATVPAMDVFLQACLSGLSQGCVYALVALGFVLIYKATEVANFAQGELMMVGAYLQFTLVGFGIAPVLALPLTLLLAAGVGGAIERVVIHPLADEPPFVLVTVTIGLGIVLRAATGMIWSHDTYAFPSPIPDATWRVGGVVVSSVDLFAFAATAAVTVLLYLFFHRTRLGTAMRAVAQNRYAAQLMGVRVQHIFTLTWALSAMVAALGGVVLADISYLHTNMSYIGLAAIPAAVLGGLESIPGALLGGLVVGLLENLAGTYLDPHLGGGLKEVFAFVVLLGVLLVRPTGMFGMPDTKRV